MSAAKYLANEFVIVRISENSTDLYTQVTGELTHAHYPPDSVQTSESYWIAGGCIEVSENFAAECLGGNRPWEESKNGH